MSQHLKNMSQHAKQRDYAEPLHCSGQLNFPEDSESLRRTSDNLQKENQHLHVVIKQLQEEKGREVEAQNKRFGEIPKEDQPNQDQQYQGDFLIKNEDLEKMLHRAQEEITNLKLERKLDKAESQEMKNILNLQQENLNDLGKLYQIETESFQDLKSKHEETLQLLQQKDALAGEMQRQLQDLVVKYEVAQDKLRNMEATHKETQLKLEEKGRELEAQSKDLGEISKQDQPNQDQQYKAKFQTINEGWEAQLKKLQQEIIYLLKVKKNKNKQLTETNTKIWCMDQEIKELQCKIEELEAIKEETKFKHEKLESKHEETLQLLQQKDALAGEMQCQLQDLVVKYEVAQDKLRNLEATQLQLLQQLAEAAEETGCYFSESETKSKSLQVKLDEAVQRNAELLQEKEQQDELDREKNKTEFIKKIVPMKAENVNLKKLCTEMNCEMQKMMEMNRQLQGLWEIVQGINELQKEAQQHEKMHEDMQCALHEMQRRDEQLQDMHAKAEQSIKDMHEAKKEQEKQYEDLKEKQAENEKKLESVEETLTQLEEANEGKISTIKYLILQNKELQERCQKKKRKDFWFFPQKFSCFSCST